MRFTPVACQRWSFRRIWLRLKLLAHCFVTGHDPWMCWGDACRLMKHIRRNSWVVTYCCVDCEWKHRKEA